MKIALLSFEFPPETGFGGIGTYTWHQARGLARLGHEVHVLAGARVATPLRTSTQDGVYVHRFWADGVTMRTFERLGSFRMWWTRQRLQNAWSMYQGIKALHRSHHFDVLEMPECGAEGAIITRLMNVPTVVRLHSPAKLIMPCYDVTESDTKYCAVIEKGAVNRASVLTSCSQFLATEVREQLGVRHPISVISNGLDLDWFDAMADNGDVYEKYGLPRRDLLIVFTGRMERRKGIHLCPEIAGAILERFNVTFAFAGDDLFGYMKETMLPALANRPLKGSLHWLGPLALGELRPLVRAADIFFAPSLWENCPYSCLEAMAAGRAIVAANQGGMPELIQHGVNGLLATCGDAASFVQELEHLITDAPLRTRLGAAARQTIDTHHRHTHIAGLSVAAYTRASHTGPLVSEAPTVDSTRGFSKADRVPRRADDNPSVSANQQPIVSVIIAAYNAAGTIAETFESLLAQTFKGWEAIVVDDGSTDETASITRHYASLDPRFVVVHQENRGESGARNTGVERARCEWLLFLDSDDWIAPTHLETMMGTLAADATLDAVHCLAVRVARDGSHVADPYEPPAGDLFPTLARRAAFAIHACVVRRSIVDAVGGFDPALRKSPDWDLWQRVARTGARFGAVREVLAFYRMQPQSASLAAEQLFRDGLTVMRRGHGPDPRVKTPAAAHAQGEPTAGLIPQQFYLLCWCAGLQIGQGKTGVDLLSIIQDEICTSLDAKAVAQILFEAIPLPSCRDRRDWVELWADFGGPAERFLAALEDQTRTPQLAEHTGRHLKQLVLRASATWGEVVEALEAGMAKWHSEAEKWRSEEASRHRERDEAATERWTLEHQIWVRIGRRFGLVRHPRLPKSSA